MGDVDGMSKKIKNWLTDESMFVKEVEDPNDHFRYRFQYPAKQGNYFEVYVSKEKDDTIIVAIKFALRERHLKCLREMESKERMAFWWDIRYHLLDRVGFGIEPNPYNPESVSLYEVVYDEELTKTKFMRTTLEVYRCYLFVDWKFIEKCAPIEEDSPSTHT